VLGWHRVYAVYPLIFRAAPALFSLVLFVPSYAAAAENEDRQFSGACSGS